MSKRILIIGCGQLGSRHLQAISTLDDVSSIVVVDSSLESLKLGKQRLKEHQDARLTIDYQWFQEIPPQKEFDLCIVATLAINRKQLLEEVFSRCNVKYFLLEKIVAQSVEDYRGIMALMDKHHAHAWVNCKSRAYGVHQEIKAMIKPQEPLGMTVVAGNQGLATNGLHEIDLFFHYRPTSQLEILVADFDPMLHPSKRGNGIIDLSGFILAKDKQGNRLSINFINNTQMPDTIKIDTLSHRFIVDHYRKLFMVSAVDHDWQWQTIAVNEPWQVSVMTTSFARDILRTGHCLLPTLHEHQPAHDFLITAIKPYLIKHGVTCSTGCPVT